MISPADNTDTAEDGHVPPKSPANRDDWLKRIASVGEASGYFEPLGAHHWALFADDGRVLYVTFENAEAIRAREDGLPIGYETAQENGWSHLCLIAEGETWYRDANVYRYFDRLVDDAFFEDFDRVIFHGAGMGSYAACAFSVTAPGATVIAVQPVATLDPRVAGWDRRHMKARRLDFTDRYGFAPDMTEGAGDVFVIFDPDQTLDAMQAALFARPHVTHLRCPLMGARLETALLEMNVLPQLIDAAGEGKLSADLFARVYRNRRRHGPYLRTLLARLDGRGRPRLAAMLCRNVTARIQAPRFRQRLAELVATGVELPDPVPLARP
jgi:hypothetical protein